MTTATAANVAGQGEKDRDKVEKRRALGRGLESLLPGPRVVAGTAPGQSSGTAGQQQVPPLRSAQDRNDKVFSSEHIAGHSEVAGEHPAELRSAGQPGAAVPTQPQSSIPTQSHSSVTTQAFSQLSPQSSPPVHTQAVAPGPAQTASGSAAAVAFSEVTAGDDIVRDEAGEPITIFAVAEPGRVPGNLVINLELTDIDKNPFQTRYVEDDEALEELADSIKANGVVQPIVVRPSEQDEGRYILILGERRLHASKKAGKTHIPALVRKVSLQQAAEMTIIENLQRENLSPLEQAEAFRVLSNEFKLTQAEIGERVGLSRVSVANYMRLLKLPREVMQMLAEKRLNFAQAKELLKLDDNDRIAEAALYAVKKGMNLEQIEMLVLRMDGLLDALPDMPGAKKKEGGGARWVDPNVRSAQVELERMLGVRVRIRDRKGKGKIVIEYSTVDDYERVVEMLRGKK